MDASTIRAEGFYGTDIETYYVTQDGRAWIVSSEDDLGSQDPMEIRIEDIPPAAVPVDGLLTPEEAIDHIERVHRASGPGPI